MISNALSFLLIVGFVFILVMVVVASGALIYFVIGNILKERR